MSNTVSPYPSPPAIVMCDHCVDGNIRSSKPSRWGCRWCQGTGRVALPLSDLLPRGVCLIAEYKRGKRLDIRTETI
jgi:hypothetical protein